MDEGHLVYGDTLVIVKNVMTLDTDTIRLVNCYIYVDNDNTIDAVAPQGTATQAVTNSQDVIVYGGTKMIENFNPQQAWIHDISWDPIGQILSFTTDRNTGNANPEDDDEPRSGTMTFRHASCPDYVVTANVYQDIIGDDTAVPLLCGEVHMEWIYGCRYCRGVCRKSPHKCRWRIIVLYDKIPVGYSVCIAIIIPESTWGHRHPLEVPVRGGCLLSIGDKPFYSGVVMRQEDKVKQFSLMLRYWKGMSILPGKSNLMFMPHGILPIGLQYR